MGHVAFAGNLTRGNEFSLCVNRAVRRNVAVARIVILAEVGHLFADVSPHLVQFDPVASELAHLLIQQRRATLTDANTQAHDRVTMNSGHSLNRPNTRTFG